MDLININALWLPVQCFSDAFIRGWYSATGINANVATNPFFAKVLHCDLDSESLAKAESLAADRPAGEVGVVIVAKDNHLQVISEVFTDDYGEEHILPVIWNARLVRYFDQTSEDMYYRIYCDTRHHGVVAGAYAVYEPGSHIAWNEKDAEAFRWAKRPYVA